MALVRCPKHGRVYDSDKESGCPLCLQEGTAASSGDSPRPLRDAEPVEPEGKSRIAIYILLAVVLLAAGATALWYFGLRDRPTKAQQERAARVAAAAAMAPPAQDTTHFPSPGDLTPVRRARALAGFLAGVMRSNRAALLGFAEGPVDTAATDKAGQRRARQYEAFVKHWRSALDNATKGGTEFHYQPGVRLASQMDQVSNAIGATVSVLRDMVRPGRVASRAARVTDLRSAQGYLSGAQTVLSNLPK